MYTSLKGAFLATTKWLNMFLSGSKSVDGVNGAIMEIGGQDYAFEETSDEWVWTHIDTKEPFEGTEVMEQQRLWFNWNLAGSDNEEGAAEEEDDEFEDPIVKQYTNHQPTDMLGSFKHKKSALDYDIVMTTEGPVRGSLSGSIRAFLGIPYAGAPVGEHRWAPAPPAEKRHKVYDARSFGNSCYQVDTALPSKVREMLLKVPTPPSEDCLNLNIYAPSMDRIQHESLLPVIFFIHGGCFSSGANSCPVYNATDMINSFNAVVVVPNYRLHVFGFLASEEMAEEASGKEGMNKSFGNYALLDVIEALRWVQANIEAFGGNPNLVTVMGQSAGAIMASYLQIILAGDAFKGESLMHRVILHSGSVQTGPVRTVDGKDHRVEPLYKQLLTSSGCADATDRLACLRATPASTLAMIAHNNRWDLMWMPVYDNVLLKGEPTQLLLQKQLLPIPTLITSCRHDGSVFTLDYKLDTEHDYLAHLKTTFGPKEAEKIAGQYPLSRYKGDPYLTATAVVTDALFKCPIMSYGAIIQPNVPSVYYMSFHRRLWVADWLRKFGVIKDPGVFHGSELIIIFNPISYITFGHSKQIRHLRRQIMKFAIVGNPILENPLKRKDTSCMDAKDELDIEYVEDAIDQSCSATPSNSLKNPKTCKDESKSPDSRQPVRLTKSALIDSRCTFWDGFNPFMETQKAGAYLT